MNLQLDVLVCVGSFRLEIAAALEGRVWGVCGPNGSGKTTLLHTVAGLITPRRGRIVLDGDTLHDSATRRRVPAHKRRIGCVFQDGRLFPHLSVAGNLRYAARRAADERFTMERIVELLDLGPLLTRGVADLSGGEQRRVAVARSLLASPRLLLLDEPLANVDASRRLAMADHLRRISDALDLPMIVVSHDRDVLDALTDRRLLLGGPAADASAATGEPGAPTSAASAVGAMMSWARSLL